MKSLVDLIIDVTKDKSFGTQISEMLVNSTSLPGLKQSFASCGYNISEDECSTILNNQNILIKDLPDPKLSY
jgi:hypothetical protein